MEDIHSSQWENKLQKLQLQYPPNAVHLLFFKSESKLEIWIPDNNGIPVKVEAFDFTTDASGKGPLIMANQPNLPEGVYSIESIANEDNALFIKTNYPNFYDRRKAKADKREAISASFYITSGPKEGDLTAILAEKTLRALINLVISNDRTEIIVFPEDPRPNTRFKPCYPCTEWYVELYSMLEETLKKY